MANDRVAKININVRQPSMWEELKSLVPKTIRGWILFLIVMIWVPQVLYDLVVKPGVGATGEIIVKAFSYVSAQMRDDIYATAALDPTALSSQSVYQLLFLAAPGVMLGALIGSRLSRRQKKKHTRELEGPLSEVSKEALEARLAGLNKSLLRVEVALLAIFFVVGVLSTYQVAAQKQSTRIWLNFNADMRIIAPKVTDLQIKELQAQFASMMTKADYVALQQRLRSLQGVATAKLKSIEE